MSAHDVFRVLSGVRFPLSNEKLLQAAIEEEFDANGVAHIREHRLSSHDVVDFLVGGVAVECKVKGGRRDTYRQLERYAGHDAVDELILVTNVPTGMPAEINGKPVYVLNLAKAWL